MKSIIERIIIVILLVFACVPIQANQENGSLVQNPDSLFKVAQQLARDGEREKSRDLCTEILRDHPNYVDAYVLMGRTLAWDDKYVQARSMARQCLAKKPTYHEALTLLLDIETWSDHYARGIEVANQILTEYPKDTAAMLRKAHLHLKMQQPHKARSIVQSVLENSPKHMGAIKEMEAIKRDGALNRIGLEYRPSVFTLIYPADHWLSLSYSRSTPVGSFIARINGRYRSGTYGLQYEVDAYPRWTKGVYSYFNFGYSNFDIWPRYKGGFETWVSLPKKFEISAGLRYLNFVESDVFIFTLSLGKYYGNWWFSARGTIAPRKNAISRSVRIQARRYFARAENYIGMQVSTGLNLELASRQDFLGEDNLLNAHSAGVSFQHETFTNLFLKLNGTVALRQTRFEKPKWVTQLIGRIGFRYDF